MLAQNNYGKSGIRLVKVHRRGENHDLSDLTVSVRFEGDFAAAHVEGDNADVLPTDTMKNTVYVLAKSHALHDIESFGLDLGKHFLDGNSGVSLVTVTIVEHPWERLAVNERPHPHAFRRAGSETRVAAVTRTREGALVETGLDGLLILKSTQSAFSGLSPFGLENENEIFVATDEPYGLIEATVTRG